MIRKICIILLLFFILTGTLVWGDESGPNSPGTMADDDTVGTQAWSNPDNAKISNGSYASCSFGFIDEGISHYLKATNFGFSIPEGATINGILVEVEVYSTHQGNYKDYDKYVKIVKADASFGSENKATEDDLPDSDTYVSYGGSNDLWSESWSAEDINNSNFGVGFSAYIFGSAPITTYVDYIRITVYYTEGEEESSSIIPASLITGIL